MKSRTDANRTPTMAYFGQLGRDIKAAWQASGFDPLALPRLAAAALAATPPAKHVDPRTLLELVVATPEFLNMGSTDGFGEPAIPVFLDYRLHIEVLFWFDGTQSIHDHTFSGVFHVLSGSSIHSHYDFDLAETLSAAFLIGRTRLRSIEPLRAGDTREILPGRQFIHALFHLEQPSTTIVIRSHPLPAYQPARVYLAPHVAIDGGYGTRSLMLRRRALSAIAQMAPDGLVDAVVDGATVDDAAALYGLLKTYVAVEPHPERLADVFDRLRPQHRTLIAQLELVFEEESRTSDLMRARVVTRSPEHRFFLALLLNCTSRRALTELIAARYPDVAPSSLILRWLGELADVPAIDRKKSNLLGFVFDDATASAVGRVLRDEAAREEDAAALARIGATPGLRALFT